MALPPNKIKYTTASQVNNAIKVKNFALGINAGIDYGPTSTTDYWKKTTNTMP